MPKQPKLGVIAGSGELPRLLVAACREGARGVYVAAIRGACDPATVIGVDHAWFELGAVGSLLGGLKGAGCGEVVLAGKVTRPNFAMLKPDWQGAKLLPRVLKAAVKGDDALLRVLVAYLEEQSLAVVGAETVVAGILAPPGPFGRAVPSASDHEDMARGAEVVRALGALDIGQAAVVRDGVVLGVEAAEGTDALLTRCAGLQGEGRGGVLVKLPKPGQERRVDLPVIGVRTVEGAIAARLNGIAVAAGGALVIERPALVRAADGAGLFVFGLTG